MNESRRGEAHFLSLRQRLHEWVRVTIWRAWHDAPTTPRKDVSEEDIARMEAERPKRQNGKKPA